MMILIQIPNLSSLGLPTPTSPFTPIDSVISLWAAAVAAVADRDRGGRPCNAVGKTCRKMRARETATSRPPRSRGIDLHCRRRKRKEKHVAICSVYHIFVGEILHLELFRSRIKIFLHTDFAV